jgi:hypothetical protein
VKEGCSFLDFGCFFTDRSQDLKKVGENLAELVISAPKIANIRRFGRHLGQHPKIGEK